MGEMTGGGLFVLFVLNNRRNKWVVPASPTHPGHPNRSTHMIHYDPATTGIDNRLQKEFLFLAKAGRTLQTRGF